MPRRAVAEGLGDRAAQIGNCLGELGRSRRGPHRARTGRSARPLPHRPPGPCPARRVGSARTRCQEEHVARHRLDRPVLVDRADESLFRLKDDTEVGHVRDGTSRCHSCETGTASRAEHTVHAIAVQVCPTPAPSGDDALADELDDSLEVIGTERAVGGCPAGERQQLLFSTALGIGGGALRHQLLGKDVQRRDRRHDRVETSGADRGEQRRALHQLVARERVEPAHRNASDMVLGPTDTLEKGGDAPGRSELAHELHRADVYAELQRSRRHDGAELPGTQARLHPEAAVHGQARVVGLDAVFPETLGKLVSDPLCHPPGVDEHKGRPVLVDVGRDLIQHRRHLIECRHGAELVIGELDGDVQPASMADVDDYATWLATGQRPVLTGAHQQTGNGRYRPLRRGEPDPDRPVLPRDQAIQSFQAEREVRTALVVGQRVDLVDDHGPHAREHLPTPRRGQQEIERLGCRDDDLRAVAQHRRTLGGRRVAVADRHLHLRRLKAELDSDLADLGEGLSQVLAHIDGEGSQRRDIHDICPSAGTSRTRPPCSSDRSPPKTRPGSCPTR